MRLNACFRKWDGQGSNAAQKLQLDDGEVPSSMMTGNGGQDYRGHRDVAGGSGNTAWVE
jgi:hypothetical protein